MKKIDLYIIKKFFGTFLFIITLILMIVIIFDISEKIDDFLESNVSINKIIFSYYLNFIPYFANLFSPLFIFISVVFFTSRMAKNTEIIAILNSGMSLNRLLQPFIIPAIILAISSFLLSSFIIPDANKERIDFEEQYIRRKLSPHNKNIHIQINKNQYIYIETFNSNKNIGYNFTLENFKEGKLISKLRSKHVKYDTLNSKWQIFNYQIREFAENKEIITSEKRIDTILNLHPIDLMKKNNLAETMNIFELNEYIKKEELKGSEKIIFYKIAKQKRIAFPFATIILTIIAVTISSKKIRGGIGAHLGLGLLISFTYILFMQISTTFAINSNLSATLAVWLPNIFYSILIFPLIYNTKR